MYGNSSKYLPVHDNKPADSSFLIECSWECNSNSSISLDVEYGNTVRQGIQYFLVGLDNNSNAAFLNNNWSTGSKRSKINRGQ